MQLLVRLACFASFACATTAAVAQPTRAPRRPVSDFDGDGLADLAFTAVEQPGEQCQPSPQGTTCWRTTGQARMTVLVFLGRDRGALSQTVELASGPDELAMGRAYELGAVDDLDGDGRTEVAITFHPANGRDAEQLLLLHGTAHGLSAPYQTVTLPTLAASSWYSARARPAGDVDGDRHPDIALGPAILHGRGDGTLRDVELVRLSGPPPSGLARVYPVGDVTGDRIADLVVVEQRAHLVLGGGKGVRALAIPTPGFEDFEAADLDGDGKAELIAVTGSAPLEVATFTLSAAGAIAGAKVKVAGEAAHGLVVADTDGSGSRDIHLIVSTTTVDVPCGTRCRGPADLHVRTIRGGTWVVEPRKPPVPRIGSGPRLYLRALGDLDGDGVEELGVVEDGTLRSRRSRGGTFELPARYGSTPKQIDVYTERAN